MNGLLRNILLLVILFLSGVILTFVLGEPQNKAVSKETKQHVYKVVIKGSEGTYSHKVDITAYSGEKRQTNENPDNTALMEKPVPGGTCAVSRDLKEYLGMKVYISGIGVYRVNDLMNERFTNRIDLFMVNREKAEDFGKKEDIQVVFFR